MFFKEVESSNPPIYTAKLDNGITLYIYDGYGVGSDGKTYSPVERENDEGDFEVVGWNLSE